MSNRNRPQNQEVVVVGPAVPNHSTQDQAEEEVIEVEATLKAAPQPEPKLAPQVVTVGPSQERLSDDDKMVSVRPRKAIGRTKIGDKWYVLTEGRTTMVPKHVARILEQKGVI